MAIFSKARQSLYNYDMYESVEGKRLRTQAQLLTGIDKPIYRDLFSKHADAVVLDIGCNEGDSALDRFTGLGVSTYIGIDKSKVAIRNAKNKYEDDFTHFFQLDITDSDADDELTTILASVGVEQVDFINISFVLLHLVEPEVLLKKLYPFLRIDGVIYVKDIDDRDNDASPDTQDLFANSYGIADHNRDSGNRNTGREIPEWLKRCGYENIKCLVKGFSSNGMNTEQKQALWDTYYGFFTIDSRSECEYTGGSKQSLYNLGWCEHYLPKMHELFMKPDFQFTLGIHVYIATREG